LKHDPVVASISTIHRKSSHWHPNLSLQQTNCTEDIDVNSPVRCIGQVRLNANVWDESLVGVRNDLTSSPLVQVTSPGERGAAIGSCFTESSWTRGSKHQSWHRQVLNQYDVVVSYELLVPVGRDGTFPPDTGKISRWSMCSHQMLPHENSQMNI